MDAICGIAIFLITGMAFLVNGYQHWKRGRGGKTTRQGRNRILISIPLLLLGLIGLIAFALEKTATWINSLTEILNLPENAKPPICYGIIILGLLGIISLIYSVFKDDIREIIQKYTNLPEPSKKSPKPKHRKNQKIQQRNIQRLVPLLDDSFDEEEFKTLCFDLGIDFDNLRDCLINKITAQND